ncbi:MAG: cupin domain-containing protein [Proteobacteria bacterium]|nr:cupin domain-containing protein [Pseudomonadota bacterium]
MTRLHLVLMLSLSLGLLASTVEAQPPVAATEHAVLVPADLKWMPAPPVLPKGVQIAVLRGNPFAEGFATVRLKIPPHTTIAPHWHPTVESFTVLKGELFVGMGDRIDKAGAQPLPAMAFASMPAMHRHYAYTGNEVAIIDVSFYGPFQIHYVNPGDDPSKT